MKWNSCCWLNNVNMWVMWWRNWKDVSFVGECVHVTSEIIVVEVIENVLEVTIRDVLVSFISSLTQFDLKFGKWFWVGSFVLMGSYYGEQSSLMCSNIWWRWIFMHVLRAVVYITHAIGSGHIQSFYSANIWLVMLTK